MTRFVALSMVQVAVIALQTMNIEKVNLLRVKPNVEIARPDVVARVRTRDSCV